MASRACLRLPRLPLLGAAALALAASCVGEPPAADPDARPIGALLPFTGGNSASGSNLERSLLLAAERINEAGGVGGRKLRIVARDTHSDPVRGLAAAKELLDEVKAEALLGPESEELAQLLGPELKARQVVQLSGGVTSPAFTTLDDGDFCYRTAPSALELGGALAERMRADGVRKAVVLHVADAYGLGFSNALVAALSARGIDAGAPLEIEPGLTSHGPLIRLAMARNPEAVVMLAYPELAAAIALEWSAVGGTMRWYLPPSLKHQLFPDNLPPALVEGMVGVAPAVADEAGFAQAFGARWHGEAPSTGAYYYFDALALWALAAEATLQATGELTPEVLRVQLRRVSSPAGEKVGWNDLARGLELVRAGQDVDYVGASGEVDLNEWGEPAAAASRLWSIRQGRIVEE